jgi:hypothetical protein
MPWAMRRTKNGFGVQNEESGKWHSRDTTREKAEAQLRLLRGTEHGWRPDEAARAPRARKTAAQRKGRPWRPE